MAFGLSKVKAYGVESEEALNKRYLQYLILDITAGASDVDLDLSDTSGTFWSAVDGSEPGDTALQALRDILVRADSLIDTLSSELLDRIKVASVAGAGQYSISVSNKAPDVAFFATDAPTAYQVVLVWTLKDSEYPVEVYEAA